MMWKLEYEVLPRECEIDYIKNWTLNYNLLQNSRISYLKYKMC